jgi:16S rRNA (cytidine1402-2'-O)-methyltransferase
MRARARDWIALPDIRESDSVPAPRTPVRDADHAVRPGTLYVVATPVGNLDDITLRALRVLQTVDVIAAEDTRHTRLLMRHFGIETPLVSYHDHSGSERVRRIADRLQNGETVALVTDAGTPGVSDPGFTLLRECVSRGISVSPVPGASALVAALSVAGLPTDRIDFVGFPPRKVGARRALLQAYRERQATLVLFESPHRVEGLLRDAEEDLGDHPAALCRELTKVFEEIRRGTVRELLEGVRRAPPRGEIVLIIGGARRRAAAGAD